MLFVALFQKSNAGNGMQKLYGEDLRMKKIFVICRYERWGKHWFKELVKFLNIESKKGFAVNLRDRTISDEGYEIRFISQATGRIFQSGIKDAVFINWNGHDVEQLYAEIEGAKLWVASS